MIVKTELANRALPDLMRSESGTIVKNASEWELRRSEIKELLLDNLWGRVPRWNEKHSFSLISKDSDKTMITERIKAEISTDNGCFSFDFDLFLPEMTTKAPVFVHIAFDPADNNDDDVTSYLISEGFSMAKVFYRDIVNDLQPDKENGIGAICQEFTDNSWGKVHMWAWSASVIADYLVEHAGVDESRMAVIGHSRLGKAALCAGALDERFSLTISNCSGAGGIALLRGKNGELIKNLCGKGSKTWLCTNFTEYANRENELPFDHHFAAALCAPRYLYIASATDDPWADPPSEFLSGVAASKAYELFGKKGLVAKEEWQNEAQESHEGSIGYHLREGSHYLSEYDWKKFVAYRKKHNC